MYAQLRVALFPLSRRFFCLFNYKTWVKSGPVGTTFAQQQIFDWFKKKFTKGACCFISKKQWSVQYSASPIETRVVCSFFPTVSDRKTTSTWLSLKSRSHWE